MSVSLEDFDFINCIALDCRELSVKEFEREYFNAISQLGEKIKDQVRHGHFGITLGPQDFKEIFSCGDNNCSNEVVESLLFYLKAKGFSYQVDDSFKNVIYITWGR